MTTKMLIKKVLLTCVFLFVSYISHANNIFVSNFSFTGQNIANHYTMVKFDIYWENSFRVSTGSSNWDAAWIFVKYRIGGGAWQHAWLNNTGHINPAGSTITTGLLDPAIPFNQTTNPGLGVFIYRDANGSGIFQKAGVQLRWNYGANGVNDNAVTDIRIYAIEMVYVPQGPFSVGSGGHETGTFYKYPSEATSYQITSEGQITVAATTNNLYYPYYIYSGDQLGPIPAAFPKGYNPFYCMKYEISQQEYADFLNSLTATQAYSRYSEAYIGLRRYGISATGWIFNSTNPYVACNYLSWADAAAFLDWSGLRPLTELEFEKSCRGTIGPTENEFAWGTSAIANSPYTLINSSANNENIATNYSITAGNAAYLITIGPNGSINGPVRTGIFAGHQFNTGRVSSGATYYGIMEMSGNLEERPITVGNPTGRAFNGTHGNGSIDVSGFADAFTWPGTDAIGVGFRGGNSFWSADFMRVSYRGYAANSVSNSRNEGYGGRGVRIAP